MDPCQNELYTALARLYTSGKYSDLTVICNDARYKVHKALLCSRSAFFDRACSSKFMEARSGEFNMSEEDDQVVQHMMNYFYYMDYEPRQKPGAPFRASAHPSKQTTKHLDMSQHDPLVATASTISPPASRASSPNDNRHHHAPTIEQTISQPPGRLRTPRALSRRHMSLRSDARTGSRASNQDSPPPLTPSSLREAELPSDVDEMELSDAEDSSAASDEDADEDAATLPLLLHARLYSAGEKYGIPGLKALAQRKFEQLLFPSSAEAFAASPLARTDTREAFLAEEFPLAIEEVYTGTVEGDRGLRNAVVQAFRMHQEWGWKAGIAEVIREHGPLAWDLYRANSGMPMQK